jgi:hypothetical protein
VCNNCGFRFFYPRLTPEQIAKLYAGYRGEEYFQQRHKYEFWYSRAMNKGIGHDTAIITWRKRVVLDFLQQNMNPGFIETVMDYGGDEGQFIPDSLGKKKFVFELSDALPVPGVTKLTTEHDTRSQHYDLVMMCHVLEHCSDPFAMVQTLRELGNFCYVEVPYENFSLRLVGRGPFYQRYLDALLHFPAILTAVDFYSTVFRVKFDVIPPLGLTKCSEHLNFFNERSLVALLEMAGLKVLACKKIRVASNWVLQALARTSSNGKE